MIEVRMLFDREDVKSALGMAFTWMEETGKKPVEVTVREITS